MRVRLKTAVNSLPAVTKIRYVACTLLEELDDNLEADKLVRAQDYLGESRLLTSLIVAQYLNFLSRIEALYSLSEE